MFKIYSLFLTFIILMDPLYTRAKEETTVMQKAKHIINFGVRYPGTKGSLAVRKYIKATLEKNGWSVYKKKFQTHTPLGKTSIENIWAKQKNTQFIHKTILLATHYDSKYFNIPGKIFYGADDGVSGTALLIQLASKIARHQFKNIQVVLLFLDAEEAVKEWSDTDSIYGSKAQVQFWKKNHFLSKIDQFILLDMVGGKNPRFCYESHSDRAIYNKMLDVSKKLNIPYFNSSCYSSVEDDHTPFFSEGVKTVDIIPYPFPSYWHTFDDTYDKLSSKTLNHMLKLLEYYLQQEDQL